MPTRRQILGVTLTASLAGLAGCTVLAPRSCTQIGCQDGLTVRLSSVPTTAFRVEVRVTSPTSQPAYVYECENPAGCAPGIFFPGFAGEQAYVTVATSTAARTTEIARITYSVSEPNGRGCPPKCRQASVTADAPA